jgi:hypothetical protein
MINKELKVGFRGKRSTTEEKPALFSGIILHEAVKGYS